MSVYSEGSSKGTTFIIDLPLRPVHSIDVCHAVTTEGIFPLGDINTPKAIIASRRQMRRESGGLRQFEAICAGGADNVTNKFLSTVVSNTGASNSPQELRLAADPARTDSKTTNADSNANLGAFIGRPASLTARAKMRQQVQSQISKVDERQTTDTTTVMTSSLSSKVIGRSSRNTNQPSLTISNMESKMSMKAYSFDPADIVLPPAGRNENDFVTPGRLSHSDSSHLQDPQMFTSVLPPGGRTITTSNVTGENANMIDDVVRKAMAAVEAAEQRTVLPFPSITGSPRTPSNKRIVPFDDKAGGPNNGSSLLVNRPLERVLEVEGREGGGLSSGASSPKASSRKELSSAGQPSLYVLVTDDSAINRKMMVKALTSLGHSCDEAEDGTVAVNKLRALLKDQPLQERDCDNSLRLSSAHSTPNRVCGVGGGGVGGRGTPPPGMVGQCRPVVSRDPTGLYDIILMDFVMPEMDGPTATRELRSMGYKGPIFGVTGNALPADIDHFLSQGADRVFTKPLNLKAFREAVLAHFANTTVAAAAAAAASSPSMSLVT